MSIQNEIKQAVEVRSIPRIGKLVDGLRFKHGMNYANIQQLFEKVAKVDEQDFEQLMLECDEREQFS